MSNVMDMANITRENLRYSITPPTLSGPGTHKPQIDKSSPLYKSAQEFEAVFIKQMLDVMRKTIDRSGLVERNQGEEIFEDMLYDEYSKNMSKSAGLGLADTMYQQLSYLQQLPPSAHKI